MVSTDMVAFTRSFHEGPSSALSRRIGNASDQDVLICRGHYSRPFSRLRHHHRGRVEIGQKQLWYRTGSCLPEATRRTSATRIRTLREQPDRKSGVEGKSV